MRFLCGNMRSKNHFEIIELRGSNNVNSVDFTKMYGCLMYKAEGLLKNPTLKAVISLSCVRAGSASKLGQSSICHNREFYCPLWDN